MRSDAERIESPWSAPEADDKTGSPSDQRWARQLARGLDELPSRFGHVIQLEVDGVDAIVRRHKVDLGAGRDGDVLRHHVFLGAMSAKDDFVLTQRTGGLRSGLGTAGCRHNS